MSAEDWQTGKSLKDRLFYMLQHQLMCDVTFLVGNDETPVRAHKLMMASASPVFYSMFNGPMAEQGTVKVPDIEINVFNDILKFIYTDDVDIEATNVNGLLYGSEKYMLHTIKEKCNHYLKSHVDDEHACGILQTAYDFHLEDLFKEALEFILQNGSSCLQSEHLLSLSPECLRQIIEADELDCKEEVAYQRAIDWASNKCKMKGLTISDKDIRTELGDLIYLIRFPIIERKFFTQNIAKNGLLTLQEKLDIYGSYDDEHIESFSRNYRKPQGKVPDFEILRCELGDSGWNHGGPSDCLGFTTSKNCYISGVLVFGSKSYTGQHDLKLELWRSAIAVLDSTNITLHAVAGKAIYPIQFENPIQIWENTRYTIRLTMKGPEVFSGKNYKSVMQAPSLDMTVEFYQSQFSANGTTDSQGQIPGIILKLEN